MMNVTKVEKGFQIVFKVSDIFNWQNVSTKEMSLNTWKNHLKITTTPQNVYGLSNNLVFLMKENKHVSK